MVESKDFPIFAVAISGEIGVAREIAFFALFLVGESGQLFHEKKDKNKTQMASVGTASSAKHGRAIRRFTWTVGYYWSSTHGSTSTANHIYFVNSSFSFEGTSERYRGYSVRLVQDYNP